MSTIGERISDIRQSRGLSVQELGKLIDVRPQFIINIEDGAQKAHTFTYRKIADALNVPLEMLLDEAYKPEKPEAWRDALPDEYRWLISKIMLLVVALGALTLILSVILVLSSIFALVYPRHDTNAQILAHPQWSLELRPDSPAN